MSEIINELLEKLKQCDDFHNRCDFLMEHSEITYMLDYITKLQQENQKYKEVINKAIKYINDNLTISSILDGKKYYTINGYSFDYKELLDILKEVK